MYLEVCITVLCKRFYLKALQFRSQIRMRELDWWLVVGHQHLNLSCRSLTM